MKNVLEKKRRPFSFCQFICTFHIHFEMKETWYFLNNFSQKYDRDLWLSPLERRNKSASKSPRSDFVMTFPTVSNQVL